MLRAVGSGICLWKIEIYFQCINLIRFISLFHCAQRSLALFPFPISQSIIWTFKGQSKWTRSSCMLVSLLLPSNAFHSLTFAFKILFLKFFVSFTLLNLEIFAWSLSASQISAQETSPLIATITNEPLPAFFLPHFITRYYFEFGSG